MGKKKSRPLEPGDIVMLVEDKGKSLKEAGIPNGALATVADGAKLAPTLREHMLSQISQAELQTEIT